MDKKALECLINSPKKDSLISNYGLQILNFKEIYIKHEILITDLEMSNNNKAEQIVKLDKKVTQNRRTIKIAGVGGLSIGIIGTLLLLR